MDLLALASSKLEQPPCIQKIFGSPAIAHSPKRNKQRSDIKIELSFNHFILRHQRASYSLLSIHEVINVSHFPVLFMVVYVKLQRSSAACNEERVEKNCNLGHFRCWSAKRDEIQRFSKKGVLALHPLILVQTIVIKIIMMIKEEERSFCNIQTTFFRSFHIDENLKIQLAMQLSSKSCLFLIRAGKSIWHCSKMSKYAYFST